MGSKTETLYSCCLYYYNDYYYNYVGLHYGFDCDEKVDIYVKNYVNF